MLCLLETDNSTTFTSYLPSGRNFVLSRFQSSWVAARWRKVVAVIEEEQAKNKWCNAIAVLQTPRCLAVSAHGALSLSLSLFPDGMTMSLSSLFSCHCLCLDLNMTADFKWTIPLLSCQFNDYIIFDFAMAWHCLCLHFFHGTVCVFI